MNRYRKYEVNEHLYFFLIFSALSFTQDNFYLRFKTQNQTHWQVKMAYKKHGI